MVEGSGALSLRETSEQRKQLLRDTVAKRRTFHPTLVHDFGAVDTRYDKAFDLVDGIYVRLTHEPFDVAAPNVQGAAHTQARLIIKDISGDCRQPVNAGPLDVLATDIAIAPSLDLIVLLASDLEPSPDGPFLFVYLRTLSSLGRRAHPDAAKSVLMFLNDAEGSPPFHLSIEEDILSVYRPYDAGSLQIFHWTSGTHLVVSLDLACFYLPLISVCVELE